ncbi:hypothetical protein ACFXMT_27675 [Streptomyces mirabilis]|uniref:hypothetical protein n=1 Tax=Streptomyces mirabilis TaxID=68239 RepID=UPI00368412DB
MQQLARASHRGHPNQRLPDMPWRPKLAEWCGHADRAAPLGIVAEDACRPASVLSVLPATRTR